MLTAVKPWLPVERSFFASQLAFPSRLQENNGRKLISSCVKKSDSIKVPARNGQFQLTPYDNLDRFLRVTNAIVEFWVGFMILLMFSSFYIFQLRGDCVHKLAAMY